MISESLLSNTTSATPTLIALESGLSNQQTTVVDYNPRTFIEQASEIGNKPISVVEIDVEECTNVYGDAATGGQCRAVLNAPNHNDIVFTKKCFECFKTCQDTERFGAQTKTIRLVTPIHGLPTHFNYDPVGLPCLTGIDQTPQSITQGQGLGRAASLNVRCVDFPYHDVGLDPYVDERDYDPLNRGTFFGKLQSRYHLEHRAIRHRVGYIDKENDLTTFRTSTYQIDGFRGPDSRGNVTIICTDRLKLAGAGIELNQPSLIPLPMELALTTDIETTSTSFGVSNGAELTKALAADGSDVVQINDEQIRIIMPIVNDTAQITQRGWGGSVIDDHSIDDNVQNCIIFNGNVTDILEAIILRTPLTQENIPRTRWDIHKEGFLSFYNFQRTLGLPTAAEALIQELSIDALFDVWLEPETNTVEIRPISPGMAGQEYKRVSHQSSIVAGSLTFETRYKEQVTRLSWLYGPESQAQNDNDNLKRALSEVDLVAERPAARGVVSLRRESSQWIGKTQRSAVAQTAGRVFAAFQQPPKQGRFDLAAKDSDLKIGDLFELEVPSSQDDTGATEIILAQVISRDEVEIGELYRYEYKSAFFRFGLRNAFIAPDDAPHYDLATDLERQLYSFISPDTGQFDDGTAAYLII